MKTIKIKRDKTNKDRWLPADSKDAGMLYHLTGGHLPFRDDEMSKVKGAAKLHGYEIEVSDCILFDCGNGNILEIEKLNHGTLSLYDTGRDQEVCFAPDKAIIFAKTLLKYCEENFSEE